MSTAIDQATIAELERLRTKYRSAPVATAGEALAEYQCAVLRHANDLLALAQHVAAIEGELKAERECNRILRGQFDAKGYVPQEIVEELNGFLAAVWKDEPGKANTLWARVRDVCAQLAEANRRLAEYEGTKPESMKP